MIDLKDGYYIKNVSGDTYKRHFALYRVFKDNFWFRQSFDMAEKCIETCESGYFIYKGNKRIGSVILEVGYMNCLVLEPPHDAYTLIIGKLKEHLVKISDGSISIGGVQPSHLQNYLDNAFNKGTTRMCMARMTEVLEYDLHEAYTLKPLDKNDFNLYKDLFASVYKEVKHDHSYTDKTIEEDLDYYFKHFKGDFLQLASSAVYYGDKLVGLCLISIWEDWPNVFEVLVASDHQNKGLGKYMLKRAISTLHDKYPVLRLFVTKGNTAETLYKRLGFISGTENTEMEFKYE